MWRTVILDVLHHYQGAFTWNELWHDTPGSEIAVIHREAARQARESQQLLAFQAFILARNPYVGGFKDLEIDDLYTGLARNVVDEPPHVPPAMRGIAVAFRLGLVTQPHVDLLGPTTIRWLQKHERLTSGPARQRARRGSRQGRTRQGH